MAHIVSATVHGLVGSTVPLKMKFDKKMNVICGPNGCGKTSLLKILDSAMNMDASTLLPVVFDSAEVVVYVQTHKKEIKFKINKKKMMESIPSPLDSEDIERFIKMNRHQRDMSVNWVTDDLPDNKTTRWAHRYLPTSRLYQVHGGQQIINASTLTELQLDEIFARLITDSWTKINADVNESIKTAQEFGLQRILDNVIEDVENFSTIDYGERAIKRNHALVMRFYERAGKGASKGISLASFKKKLKENRQFEKIVSDIVIIEESVEIYQSGIDRFKNIINDIWGRGKSVVYNQDSIEIKLNNGNSIPISRLSSGEKQIIRILLEALLAGQNTMLIDEPELSMHVDWQRNILQYFRDLNDQSQIIVATHSPEIASSVSDENIFMIWNEK